MFIDYIRLIRASHWVKNLILFTPFIFARKFQDFQDLFSLLLLFIIFCILSSAIYIFNDICDFKEDSRYIIIKKEKPIANKKISLKFSKFIFIFLFILGIILLKYFTPVVFFHGLAFLALNVLYSIFLKKILIVDAISISISYLIRTISGAALISVEASNWLLSLVFFVSLFVVFSKRYSESLILKNSLRKSEKKINNKLFKYLALINCFLSLFFYSLYVFIKNPELILTVPLTYFIFYRLIINLFNTKLRLLSPVNTLFKDKLLLFSLVLWVLISIEASKLFF